MLYEVMKEINNFFEIAYVDGRFTISDDGEISPSGGLINGAYIAITGSALHDGVYMLTDGWLGYDEDIPFGEEFDGRVWVLKPPAAFVKLCRMIEAFSIAAEKANGPYQSESFGEYSYTKANGANGGLLTWQEAFAAQLAPYRRMLTEVDC